jgi:hypothetical protein
LIYLKRELPSPTCFIVPVAAIPTWRFSLPDKITTKRKKTEYIVQRADGTKVKVASYKDWRDGEFDTLANTGNAAGKILPQRTDVPIIRTKKATIADQAF